MSTLVSSPTVIPLVDLQAQYAPHKDEILAAILRVKLRHQERWNEERRAHARHLAAMLAKTSLDLPGFGGDAVYDVFHLFAVRHPERDRLRTCLAERGIITSIHYPVPIHLQPAYAWLGYACGTFLVAERWASQCLSLPMYAELSVEPIERIAAAIREFNAFGSDANRAEGMQRAWE
jgi:dTDP-4-amino-4,6-dideoxygalactose transaminase